ncbi:MAG: methyltransferase domain-containing protein [Chloroflexi bacterium]|nr:methyltransferase domain-containing protein [Chloroflexota bacterium]
MSNVNEYSGIERARAQLLRAAFEALYGPFAWAYDWVSRTFFLGQWRLWQRTSLHFLRGARLLEVGMGTGSLQVALLRAGYEAWGVDLSAQMLRQARLKSRRLGITMRVCRARAEALPFPSSYFDAVVSTFPSDYITRRETLEELARVLAGGGRLVIVPGGWLKPRDARGKAFEGLAELVYGYRGSNDNRDATEAARRLSSTRGALRWVSTLRERMAEAGFTTAIHLASNSIGSCLVVVGDKEKEADQTL